MTRGQASHLAHEDERNRVSSLARHENEVRRLLHERWERRITPLMNTASKPSPDFDGCTE
jgi:anti-sigma-K factor RskA